MNLFLPFIAAILTHVSSVLVTFVTLTVFISINDNHSDYEFTAGRLFSALALFNQLTVALFIFPITIPIIIGAIVSTKRLEKFLELPEVKKEFEGVQNMARVLCRSDASLDIFENVKKTNENDSIIVPLSSSPPPPSHFPISTLFDETINPLSSSSSSSANIHSASSTSKIINSSNNANLLNENDETTPLTPNENNEFDLINNSSRNSTVFNSVAEISENKTNTSTSLHADYEVDDCKLNDISSSNNNESIKYSSLHTNNSNSKIKLKKNHQLSMSAKTERNRHRQKSITEHTTDFTQQLTLSKNVVVDIKNAKFSWYALPRCNDEHNQMCADADTPASVLYINKLKIPKGEFFVYFFMSIGYLLLLQTADEK